MAEQTDGLLHLEEANAKIMKRLLRFLYTDALDQSDLSCEEALDLVVAADRFSIASLAELALGVSILQLTPCSINKALSIALLYPEYKGSVQLINAIGFLCLEHSEDIVLDQLDQTRSVSALWQ